MDQIPEHAWRAYSQVLARMPQAPQWWTTVAITASSRRQADRYRWEIERRRQQDKLPASTRFVVIPDPQDRRVGSGGATIHALHELAGNAPGWWSRERVLLIHSGGDSRRLPIYSVVGKLFCALPTKTPWGETSTIFDEWMAGSTLWVEAMPPGLLVGSGDVVLTFDARPLDWTRAGAAGIAMRQPAEVGSQHGVYIPGERGHVRAFLQKPSLDEARAAGGLLADDHVALDSGLIRFCPDTAERLAALAPSLKPDSPAIDLYQHITMALTGQWHPCADDPAVLHQLSAALEGVPFWVETVEGRFMHIGTTKLFLQLMTQATLSDSLAIECSFEVPVRAGRHSILFGLEDIRQPLDVPDETVLHQSSVVLPDATRATVIRVYGVADDPKLAACAGASWFGRPIIQELARLNIDPEEAWPGLPPAEWTLWNARLFPATDVQTAWDCVRWLLGRESTFSLAQWRALERLSLAGSAQFDDTGGAPASYARRLQADWVSGALALAESGSDVRPMLAYPPTLRALTEVARGLHDAALRHESTSLTEAASRHFQSGLFLDRAGLTEAVAMAHDAAFRDIETAVQSGIPDGAEDFSPAKRWTRSQITVAAPARIDLGGGWSDTPPFCLDWGGSVLNIAVAIDGTYPIRTSIRVLEEPLIRCWSGEDNAVETYRTSEELMRAAGPGDPFAIPRTALRLSGLFQEGEPLVERLKCLGGGLDIRTHVDLPMGSGLGASSILAATMLRAIAELSGGPLGDQSLSDRVMRLEQRMTTGGGWQDQAGGIFPGAKLIHSGPGNRQRLRIQPVAWTPGLEAEFETRMVLFYTGIRRIARNLLHTVVGRYLARETAAVQVLHSIKTLSGEMAYAMQEGDWPHLGRLLDRHWELNQVLDPQTTNVAIDRLLGVVRPYIHGAKLAGAGGGGFLMLLSRDADAATQLRHVLRNWPGRGAYCNWGVAREGLKTEPG